MHHVLREGRTAVENICSTDLQALTPKASVLKRRSPAERSRQEVGGGIQRGCLRTYGSIPAVVPGVDGREPSDPIDWTDSSTRAHQVATPLSAFRTVAQRASGMQPRTRCQSRPRNTLTHDTSPCLDRS